MLRKNKTLRYIKIIFWKQLRKNKIKLSFLEIIYKTKSGIVTILYLTLFCESKSNSGHFLL